MTTNNSINIGIMKNIEETGEFFIVPNTASVINENSYAFVSSIIWYESIMKANGHGVETSKFQHYETYKEMSKSDPLVQVWIATDRCKDFTSDLPAIKDEFGIYHFVRLSPYIPLSLIKDVKEGDTITLNLPVDVFVDDIPAGDYIGEYKSTIRFTLTAAQDKYRYRGFGPFEKALDIVARKYKEENEK